jgi:hypothetical protein
MSTRRSGHRSAGQAHVADEADANQRLGDESARMRENQVTGLVGSRRDDAILGGRPGLVNCLEPRV